MLSFIHGDTGMFHTCSLTTEYWLGGDCIQLLHYAMKGCESMDMNTIIKGVVLTKVCSIKPDGDSTESKNINLHVSFEGATLQGVFDKALSSAVISWQNTVGRKHFDEYKSGQIVKVEFKSPGRSTVDPETAIKGKLAAMTADEREAYIRSLLESVTE